MGQNQLFIDVFYNAADMLCKRMQIFLWPTGGYTFLLFIQTVTKWQQKYSEISRKKGPLIKTEALSC